MEDLKQIGFTEEWTIKNKQLAEKLGLNLTGCVGAGGRWCSRDAYGFLCSASPVGKGSARAFGFDGEKGRLFLYYGGDHARPCLYLITHKETRKDIYGYEGLYKISDFGNVKSIKFNKTNNEKLLKLRNDGRGYFIVSLSGKNHKVHRLVATTFIKNIENKKCVNHKDGNKQNNNVENLERCTYQENEKHSFSELGKKPTDNLTTFIHNKINIRLKNSSSDNLSIGLFEQIVERAEENGAKLGAKAGYTLGKILLDNK